MSTVQYLFGNVDERGNLEDSELDLEIKQSLESGGSEYLSRILSDSLEFSRDDWVSNEKETIKPLGDAQDFSEIQELAQDDSKELLVPKLPPTLSFSNNNSHHVTVKAEKVAPTKKLYQMNAKIVDGRIRFTDIFGPRETDHLYDSMVPDKKTFVLFEDEGYKIGKDDRDLFFIENNEEYQVDSSMQSSKETLPKEQPIKKQADKSIEKSFLPVELDEWEKKILWDDSCPSTMHRTKIGFFRNQSLDRGDWLDCIQFDEGQRHVLPVTFEDPAITLDIQPVNSTPEVRPMLKTKEGKPIDRFNISDDMNYEIPKSLKADRIRQVVGPAVIEHALPAIKLHMQYYKPQLTTKELRSFHRPTMRFPLNQDIKMSRLKVFKKKKAKGKDPSELMKRPKDISLRDTCPFVLLEYSEEYPMILQNPGMATMIYNYYRKKDEKDNFIPKLTNGAAYILESVDASPFFGFGDVEPGETIQAIYNHLIRAPIFKHEVNSTDFLLIKQTFKGKTRFFIREIPHIYVVGQCYPVQEVPRPQSRKIIQTIKGRIQAIAFRLMRRDPLRRLKFQALAKAFPCYSEMELRNRIKEYAQYAKKGENTGWWKLNSKTTMPTEEGIRKIVTPEMVCLTESMHVGQQRLNDSGFGNLIFNENDDGNEDDEASNDIEVLLAPWTTSKNFILAAQGKGMIQLFGPGDPTGCGEAFSFLRSSMKEMFFREGESEAAKAAFIDEKTRTTYHKFSIAEQQQVYKGEIRRIWGNQLRSLMASEPNDKIFERSHELEDESSEQRMDSTATSPTSMSPANHQTKEAEHYSDIEETQSNATSQALGSKNRILVINRLVRNRDNQFEWKSEVISDVRVMSAYLRQRTLIEKTSQATGSEPPFSEEEEKQRRRRKIAEHLAALRQNRRGKRKAEGADDNSVTVKISLNNASNSKRRKTDGLDASATKLVLKRRTPQTELSSLFEKFIKALMALPESWPFCNAVSKEHYTDYYDIVKNPKTLQDIQNDVNNNKYQTAIMLLNDLQLIGENCRLYNGENHSLTLIAKGLYDKGVVFVEEHRDEINQLSSAITPADAMNESLDPNSESVSVRDSTAQMVNEQEEMHQQELGDGFVF